MVKLLRAIACIVLAVAMASVSVGASAHGAIVIDEAGYHDAAIASELPCADCGSHRLRVCAQSCLAGLESDQASLPAIAVGIIEIDRPNGDTTRPGKPPEPLLGPPIA